MGIAREWRPWLASKNLGPRYVPFITHTHTHAHTHTHTHTHTVTHTNTHTGLRSPERKRSSAEVAVKSGCVQQPDQSELISLTFAPAHTVDMYF